MEWTLLLQQIIKSLFCDTFNHLWEHNNVNILPHPWHYCDTPDKQAVAAAAKKLLSSTGEFGRLLLIEYCGPGNLIMCLTEHCMVLYSVRTRKVVTRTNLCSVTQISIEDNTIEMSLSSQKRWSKSEKSIKLELQTAELAQQAHLILTSLRNVCL